MRVTIPPIAPRYLPAITVVGTQMDNDSDAAAAPPRAMEKMANHLLGARQVSAAGMSSPYKISGGGIATWNFTLARGAHSDRLRCLIYVTTQDDTIGSGTITVTSTLGSSVASLIPSVSHEYVDAVEYEVWLDWGAGVAADMGTDDVSVVVAMTLLGALVWSITFEPVGHAAPYGRGYLET